MKLPKSFTKVTPLSKALAMILFVIFPFAGFCLGMKYQKLTNVDVMSSQNLTNNSTQVVNPSFSSWKKYINDTEGLSIKYPSEALIVKEKHATNNWYLLISNDKQAEDKIGPTKQEGVFYVQIEIFNSAKFEVPFSGGKSVTINESNLDIFQQAGSTKAQKGFLRSRPTLKSYDTIANKEGHVVYSILDGNRLIKIKADTNNLGIIPYSTLNNILDSFTFTR